MRGPISAPGEAEPRLTLRLTRQQYSLLEELSGLGIHGVTPAECARHLIANELVRLLTDGFFPTRVEVVDEDRRYLQ
jgi:hypothetical protein